MPEYPVVRIEDVPPEPVREEEGWRRMDFRLPVNRARSRCSSTWFRTLFPPGARHKKHKHLCCDEIYYLIRGRAAAGAGEEEQEAGPGCCHYIPRGVVHWLRNLSEVEEVEVVGVYLNAGSLEETGYVYVGEVTEGEVRARRGVSPAARQL